MNMDAAKTQSKTQKQKTGKKQTAKRQLRNTEISYLCMELSLLIHAGVGVADGLALLAEETGHGLERHLLIEMSQRMDQGESLPEVLRKAGCFPDYMSGLVEVGERSGRMEEALSSLSVYYEDRERRERHIRSALMYPVLLLFLMLIVVLLLLSRVLPVFNQVYSSLGGRLTGLAGGLLTAGQWLNSIMPLLCGVLILLAVLVAVFSGMPAFREKFLAVWQKKWGDKGLSRKLNDARLAQGLAMGLKSGLPLEEALILASELQAGPPEAKARCQKCAEQLAAGEELSTVLKESGMLPPAACRLLTLGMRGGYGDTVMDEVARRLTEESETALDNRIDYIEPILVLAASVLVGIILLSVMLPLMDIMSAIG